MDADSVADSSSSFGGSIMLQTKQLGPDPFLLVLSGGLMPRLSASVRVSVACVFRGSSIGHVWSDLAFQISAVALVVFCACYS